MRVVVDMISAEISTRTFAEYLNLLVLDQDSAAIARVLIGTSEAEDRVRLLRESNRRSKIKPPREGLRSFFMLDDPVISLGDELGFSVRVDNFGADADTFRLEIRHNGALVSERIKKSSISRAA